MTPALAQFRKTASRLELAIGLNNLGTYLTGDGRISDARPIVLEALHIGHDGRHLRIIVLAVQTCATIAALAGLEKRRCVQLFGYVARRYEVIGELEYTELSAHEQLRTLVRGTLPEADYADAIREGEAFDDETAVEVALRCIEPAPRPTG